MIPGVLSNYHLSLRIVIVFFLSSFCNLLHRLNVKCVNLISTTRLSHPSTAHLQRRRREGDINRNRRPHFCAFPAPVCFGPLQICASWEVCECACILRSHPGVVNDRVLRSVWSHRVATQVPNGAHWCRGGGGGRLGPSSILESVLPTSLRAAAAVNDSN